MNCTHEKPNHQWIDGYEDDWGVAVSGYWDYGTISLLKDVDVHRYKCTGCNKIFYYSGAARDYYENGMPCEIIGLGV